MTAPNAEEAALQELLAYLRAARGFDFTGYKRPSLVRRIGRRMHDVGVTTFGEYLDYLQVHPNEFGPLFNTILINVTSFFRDREAWDLLAAEVLPAIVDQGTPIRAWSAGCASGEEAYTLAILLAEAVGTKSFCDRVKIFATDVDEEALALARHASYAEKDVETIPQELREKYFTAAGDRFTFRSDLRRAISFGRHDLIQDAPISRLDLLVCRNTLMYFDAETQARVLARFCFALKDTGVLFLGKAEMLFSHAQLFAPLSLKHRLFRRLGPPNGRERIAAMAPLPAAAEPEDTVRRLRLRDLAFEVAPMAKLVVDADGTVAQVNERARSLFGIGDRDLGRPLQDLELSYRPVELRSHLEEAYAKRRSVVVRAERGAADGTLQRFVVHFTPLFGGGDVRLGAVVSYEDVTEILRLQDDLRLSNQHLETTNEELQSTNEELETTNEELQSTNEELETMNAELQSTNEELDSINRQLQERTQSLEDANLFQASVFASVQAGLVVIDRDFEVRIWNAQSEELWGVRAEEAIGRPLFTLELGLPLESLREPIVAQLAGRDVTRDCLLPATNRRGKAIECRVSCTPLRGRDGRIDGVILMMEGRDRPADAGGAPAP
jgi:two-component system, chemotaxis family, CheB/CheR fusion protein